MKDKLMVLFNDKKVDETIAGMANKIMKGLVIPPVKKTSTANWIRSYVRYKVELKLLKRFTLTLNCKKILVKAPEKIIIKQ